MEFGIVLEYIKHHPFINCKPLPYDNDKIPYYRFRRNIWDKNEHIYLVRGRSVPAEMWNGIIPFNTGSFVEINDHIDKVNTFGHIITGWIPSTEDMLADDWEEYKGIQ
jgi:hypothetical protein